MTKKPLRPPPTFSAGSDWDSFKLTPTKTSLWEDFIASYLSYLFGNFSISHPGTHFIPPHTREIKVSPSHVNWILLFTLLRHNLHSPLSPLSPVFQILPYQQFLQLSSWGGNRMTASFAVCLFFHLCCADGFDSLGRCHCCTLLRSMFRQKETEGLRSPGDILDKGRKCCLGLISEEIFSMRCQNLQPYDLHCSGETFTVQCFHHIGVLLGSDLGHLIDDLQLDALVA